MADISRDAANKVSLDTAEAVQSIKSLKAEISSNTAAWKAHEATLKQAGETLEAAKSRYNGLSSSVTKQRSVVEGLSHSMELEAKNTSKNSTQYQELQTQYDRATTKLVTLTNQQGRAKQSLDYQQSGISKLNESIKQSSSLTDSYVERLKAEGNQTEATKTKINGLKDQQGKLNQLYKKQKEELEKLKSAEGNNSEAIAKQNIRVNETATRMARAASQTKDLREQLNKRSSNGFLSGLTSKLDSVNEKTDRANHLFGKIVGAHLVATGITNAFQSITTHIKEATEAGLEYDKEQQKMQAVWLTLTGSNGSAKQMVNTINDLSVKTGQAVETVDELEQGFYHLHSNKTESDALTKSMLNMADAVGLDSQQIQAVTQDMVNGLSRGKANAGMLNQISQYFPMFRENLAKYETDVHHGKEVTTADLTAMAKAGKISATDIENVFNKLGSGQYDKAADNMLQTMSGMERTIKARVPALIGAIEKPVMEAQNPFYGAVSKWVSDPKVSKEFTKVGESAEKGFETITKAFAKAYNLKSVPDTLNSGVNGLAKGITNASNIIARNAPEIVNFFKMTKEIGGEGFRVLVTSLEIANTLLKPFMGLVADHPQAVAKTAASIFLLSKAFGAVNSGIGFVNTTLKTFNKIGDGIKWAAKVFGIKSETAALKEQNKVLLENNELSSIEGNSSLGTSASGGSINSASGKVGKEVKTAKTIGKEGKLVEEAGQVAKGSSKLGMLSKLKGLSGLGKGLVSGIGVLDVVTASTDLIGMNKKNVGTKTGSFAGNLAGAGAGAAIGTAILPGIGTAIGAGLGSIGGDKLGGIIGKEIQKGLSKTKLKPPKISTKSSLSKLEKEYKKYYKNKESQDEKDLKVLYKNGDLTKAEYQKRLTYVKTQGNNLNKFSKMSESDRTAVAKYYAQQRQSLEETWNKKISSTKSKWSKKIIADTNQYGINSIQVQKDQSKKAQAIAEDEKNKKAAIGKLTLKNATSTTIQEAKLHTTLDGKIQLSANKQMSIFTKLTKDKGKLSNKQLQNAVNDAQKEYDGVKKMADKKYNDVSKAAYKQYMSVLKAATNQRKEAVKAAEGQYKDTIDAASRQYKGNSKWAEQQRADVKKKAESQRDSATKAAWDQYNGVVAKAQKQQTDTDDAAKKQHDTTIGHSRDQKNQIVKSASDQSKGVVTHAINQANSSMKANSKQGGGLQSIWNGISSFFNGIIKFFGQKAIKTSKQDYSFAPMGMAAYAVGTGYANGNRALVGEAGIEARYQPYSGKVDFVGVNGAQVVNLNPGDKILNAKDTAKLFNGGLGKTLPGYASGTDSLSSFISSVGKGASSIWNNVSSAAQDTLSKLTNPVKTLQGIAEKAFDINSIAEVGDGGHEISKSMVDSGVKSIGSFLNKLVKQSNDYGSANNPGGSSVNRWKDTIEKAASKMHVNLTSAGMSAVLKRVNQESGGNPNAVNNWDLNAAKGTPSKGILQYIQPTLDYWVPKGATANLVSGYTQFLALFNDSNWLKDISVPGGWGPTGMKRFANGGFSSKPAIFGDDGLEVAIPLTASKKPRAVELLDQTRQLVTGQDSTTTNSEMASLLKENNQLVSVLTNIVNSIFSEVQRGNQPMSVAAKNQLMRDISSLIGRGIN